MEKTILIVIITIIVWQFICTIVDLVTNENMNILAIFAFGIFIPIIGGINAILNWAVLLSYKMKYNSYYLVHNKEHNDKPSNILVFMRKKDFELFNHNEKDEYYVKLRSSGKEFKSIPDKQNIIKYGIIKEYNKGFTQEYIDNYKRKDISL